MLAYPLSKREATIVKWGSRILTGLAAVTLLALISVAMAV